jgi:hypothetical protein
MKKGLIAVILALVLIIVLAIPAFAGKGAVKVDLWQIHGPTDNQIVGSVVMNTTASGCLIVVVNIDTVPDQGADAVTPPLEDYDVRVFIEGSPTTFDDVFSTNANGQGNATVKVPLGDYGEADEIMVNIVIRDFNGSGLGFYETLWNQNMVPLK